LTLKLCEFILSKEVEMIKKMKVKSKNPYREIEERMAKNRCNDCIDYCPIGNEERLAKQHQARFDPF